MKFVIDTNILIKGFQLISLDCFALIGHFYDNSTLAIVFDTEKGILLQEYRQNLNHNEMFQKWLVAMFQANKVFYVSGKLEEKIRKKLDKLGFHEPSDQVFVAVALHSDKNIITEDSDYGKGKEDRAKEVSKQEILRYMTNDLKLNVTDAKQSLKFIKNLK